jgi:AcrR family transcriptional regulator
MTAETVLQKQLAAPPATRRPTALDALKLASRAFLAGQRVDMGSLASTLGVSRVTIYRWVGSREQLLTEVAWSLSVKTLDKLEDDVGAAQQTRGPRTGPVLIGFVHTVLGHAGFRRFLETESDLAMTLLTVGSSGFQPRLIARVQALLTEDVADGRLQTSIPLDDLAYTLVRIAESFAYSPFITGQPADAARADRVITTLLQAAVPASHG